MKNRMVANFEVELNIENSDSGLRKANDSRFTEVIIDVMHMGKNRKGWIFPKPVVLNALHTLNNIPIVAFIKKDEFGRIDFNGHDAMIGETENGSLGVRFVHQAFGVIPESFNHEFIKRKASDGIEREYLRVNNALLWNKWGDPLTILKRTGSTKVSMEIEFDEENYEQIGMNEFLVNSFDFTGICLLGDNNMEGIVGSNARLKEKSFSIDSLSIEGNYKEMLEDFKNFTKGGNNKMKDVLVCKECGTATNKDNEQSCKCESFEIIKQSEFEEKDTKDKVIESKEVNVDDSDNDDKDKNDDKDDKVVDNKDDDKVVEETFSQDELDKTVKILEGMGYQVFSKDDSENSDEEDKEDKEPAEEKEEPVGEVEDVEELINNLKSENEVLKSEVEDLKEFKEQAEQERLQIELEKVFSMYESLKGIEEFDNLKKEIANFSSVDEVKSKIGLIVANNLDKIQVEDDKQNDSLSFSYTSPKVGNSIESKYANLINKYTK